MASGVVVNEFPPYWEVVRKPDPQRRGRRHIVVDSSVSPSRKVHGPTSLALANAYARLRQRQWNDEETTRRARGSDA